MAVEVYLYPGVGMSVTQLTKVTLEPMPAGTVPPPGSTIIPPQPPAPAQSLLAAHADNAQAALVAQSAEAVKAAADAHAALAQATGQPPPPWSVTFTEQR